MNKTGWISIAVLELVFGAVLLFLGTAWRYPHSHFRAWVGMQYGAAFVWAWAPEAARLHVAAVQGPALLVGSLLVGSAVFIYWELVR
jgi:hypothetical protein